MMLFLNQILNKNNEKLMKCENNIIIGSGPLGLSVAEILLKQYKKVTIVNRSGKINKNFPKQINVIAGDASDPKFVYKVCRGADVVFHCAMPRYTQWENNFFRLTKGIFDGIKLSGCRLVYGDNLYCYGNINGAAYHENLPYQYNGNKGQVRASMAEMLLGDKDMDVAIGRASDFYGPMVENSVLSMDLFESILLGKKINLLGNIDLPHTFTYIKDFAAALVRLSENEDAFGQVWHVPNAPTITTRQLIDIIAKKVDKPIKLRTTGESMVAFLGLFNSMLRELKEVMYQWQQPYLVESKKFNEKFGNKYTPHDIAVDETLNWIKSNLY